VPLTVSRLLMPAVIAKRVNTVNILLFAQFLKANCTTAESFDEFILFTIANVLVV